MGNLFSCDLNSKEFFFGFKIFRKMCCTLLSSSFSNSPKPYPTATYISWTSIFVQSYKKPPSTIQITLIAHKFPIFIGNITVHGYHTAPNFVIRPRESTVNRSRIVDVSPPPRYLHSCASSKKLSPQATTELAIRSYYDDIQVDYHHGLCR